MPGAIDAVLVALIVVGLPAKALWSMRELRRAPGGELERRRSVLWTRAILSQWTLVAAVVALWLVEHRAWSALRLPLLPTPGLLGVLLGTLAILRIVVLQRRQIAADPALRERVRARLAPVRELMPASSREWPHFAALAITAGVCEEFLFRGFLLAVLTPVLGLPLAAVANVLAFGIGHAYQGTRGIVLTGLVGAFLTCVTLLTGSVWPAMVLHALMDLNAGDIAHRMFGSPDRA